MVDTQEKIRSFSELPTGWHYGHGVAVSQGTVAISLLFESFIKLIGFPETDAFPGITGEVMVAGYSRTNHVQVTVEPDGTFRLAHEVDGLEVFLRGRVVRKRCGKPSRESIKQSEAANMGFVRLVHPRHYDGRKGKFIDLAFRPQSNAAGVSGVSCFEQDCAVSSSGSICEHISKFYGGLAHSPAVFWLFAQSDLPQGSSLTQSTEDNGDHCHYNVVGISGTAARKVPLSWQVTDLMVCDSAGFKPLTLDVLQAFKAVLP